MLLDNCYAFGFVTAAFWSEEGFWRKGPSSTYYGTVLDLLLGRFSPKVNTNVQGHENFITTKFGKYPLNDSVVKADYVFPYIHMH